MGHELVVADVRRAADRGPPRGSRPVRAAGIRFRPRARPRSGAQRDARLRDPRLHGAARTDDYEARGERRGGRIVFEDDRRARHPRRRHRPSHRLVGARLRDRRLAPARRSDRCAADAGDRPLLVRVGLLPRAGRHPLRAGHPGRRRLRRRRGARADGTRARAAAVPRVPARAGSSRTLTPLPDTAPGVRSPLRRGADDGADRGRAGLRARLRAGRQPVDAAAAARHRR